MKNFFSLLDQHLMSGGRPFIQSDTLASARPSFLGGDAQMVPPPQLQVADDPRAPMTLPLTGQYPAANVPVPVPMSDLVGAGGTDPYNLEGNPTMRPRFPAGGFLPLPPADVNRGLIGPGQEAPPPPPRAPQPDLSVAGEKRLPIPLLDELPPLLQVDPPQMDPIRLDPIRLDPFQLQAPVADTGLLNEPYMTASSGVPDPTPAAKPSALATNFRRLGAVAQEQQRQGSNMPEAPRLSLQAPTAGVGGRAVDLSAYLRQPLGKRSARKA